MDMPFIISAEAAVQSKRPGYVSIFDPKAKDIPGGLKPFYADPPLIKRAAERLKADGFLIRQTGKITIGIQGSAGLFESIFGITLRATERGPTCEGSNRFGYIDTEKGSYRDILAGIALMPAVKHLGEDDDIIFLPGHKIRPSQLPLLLNLSSEVVEAVKHIDFSFAVVDTGFDNHPDIAESYPDWEPNINLITQSQKEIFEAIEDEIDSFSNHILNVKGALWESFHGSSLETDVIDTISYKDMPQKQKDDFTAELKKVKEKLKVFWGYKKQADLLRGYFKEPTNLKRLEDCFEAYDISLNLVKEFLKEPDWKYHGTQVTCTMLGLLKGLKGKINVFQFNGEQCALFPITQINETYDKSNKRQLILNCSYGTELREKDAPHVMDEKAKRIYEDLVKDGVTIVFAAGNRNAKYPSSRDLQTQWPFVISAGGAYQDIESEKRIFSNVSHGYRSELYSDRIVPDVCGVEGPEGDPKIILPKENGEDWEAMSGTSFCAPQVSVACAIIKAIWPDAGTHEIKSVLIESADAIESGESAQGIEMKNLTREIEVGDIIINKPPGLLNFEKAVRLAVEKRDAQISRIEQLEY